MYWVIFFSAWGGFVLGVLLMAVLSITREENKYRTTRFARQEPFAPPQK